MEEVHKHEPHVVGLSALRVPSTGIIESEELTKAFARVATEQGANVVTDANLKPSSRARKAYASVPTVGELETQALVNCAGLFSDEVAALFGNGSVPHLPGTGRVLGGGQIEVAPDQCSRLPCPGPHGD